MKNQLYIHVGAGKTGTSSIQVFLKDNRDALMECGLCVPQIGVKRTEHYLAHHSLSGVARFLTGDNIRQWKEIAALGNSKILVTSELFHSLVKKESGLELFRSVKSIFASWKISIIFYIRRHDQWLESAYAEWLKTGHLRTGEDLDQFALAYGDDQTKQIDKFEEIFGPEALIIRPYEKCQLNNGDVVDDFLEIFGLSSGKKFKQPNSPVNRSLPAYAVDVKRIFNSICEDAVQARTLNADIWSFADSFGVFIDPGPWGGLGLMAPSTRVHLLNEELRTRYKRIARQHLGRGSGELFEKSFADIEEREEDYSARMKTIKLEEKRLVAFILRRCYERANCAISG